MGVKPCGIGILFMFAMLAVLQAEVIARSASNTIYFFTLCPFIGFIPTSGTFYSDGAEYTDLRC